jgi:two-component system sensor histidine kinase TorS
MLSRLGIGARLFLAFLGITALSLSSGVAGWLILREISAAQSRINSEALPAVAAAQRTAETTARLVAAAPALTAARNEAARAMQENELLSLAAQIRRSVSDASLSTLDDGSMTRLSSAVDALVSNLSSQSLLVRERMSLQERFAARAERTIVAATAIVDLSETLVSNASAGASAVVSNLYSLIDDPARHQEAYDALDRLIEQDIFLLDRMWELRLRSSQIGLLTNRLTRALDRQEVAEIAGGFAEHLRVVRRRVASIDDPVRREQAAGFLGMLEAAAGNSPVGASLFGDRVRLVTIGEELERVAEDNSNLSAQVSAVAQGMLERSQSFALTTSAQAGRAVDIGLYVLVITSLVAVAISGLIVGFYVERGVVRRLESLTGAMQRLTEGDLAVEVTPEGTRELKALSSAVVAFRDESQKRRTLEIERERINEELRRHREELQDLVTERTALLQQEVESHAVARERAESASRAKSDFLATMSHEIRTPMTGMLGMLRILRESELTPPQHRHLAAAANSGEALLGILNSILDYSKIESGKIGVDPVDFSLRELLKGVADLMRPSAVEKGLKLSLDIDTALAAQHRGDVGKIRQIVFNLVSNAIKFTPRGRVRIAAVVQQIEDGQQRVEISVEDTGIGIPDDEQGHIFESFTQTDASITRRYGGTGLGLSISRGLANAMAGTLSVTSRVGQGSLFTLGLVLPVAVPGAVSGQPRTRRRKAKGYRVLVVEDDEATRLVACKFLEDMGHEAIAAEDGYGALRMFNAAGPDLVLMDISLPGLDGIATARQLRASRPEKVVPIIAMSAHVFKEEVDRYLASGMDAYVAKPISPESLGDAIATVFRAPRENHVDRTALDADVGALGRDAVLRILSVVDRTLPQRFEEMHTALTSGDMEALARLAHVTYSSAAAAGFRRLCDAAAALEAIAKSGPTADAGKLIAECESHYRSSMAEARRHVGRRQAVRPDVAAKR